MRKRYRRLILLSVTVAIIFGFFLPSTAIASFSANADHFWQEYSLPQNSIRPIQIAQNYLPLCSDSSLNISSDRNIERLLMLADSLYEKPVEGEASSESFENLARQGRWNELIASWHLSKGSLISNLSSEEEKVLLGNILIQTNLIVSEDFSKPLPIQWQDIYEVLSSHPVTDLPSYTSTSWTSGYIGYLFENIYRYLDDESFRHSLSSGTAIQIFREEREGALDIARAFTRKALCLAEESQDRSQRDGIYKWQWQIARILSYEGEILESEKMYLRAQQTVDALEEKLASSNASTRFDFRDRVENLYRDYITLVTTPGSTIKEPNKETKRTIDSMQLNDLENLLDCIINARNLLDVDSLIDDENAAIIYPIILKERLEVLWKLPCQKEFSRSTVSVSSKVLEQDILDFQEELEKPYFSDRGVILAKRFYDQLIRKFESDATTDNPKALETVDTLVFVLDKELRNIPMAALYDKADDKFLVEKYAIGVSINGLEFPRSEPRRGFHALLAGLYSQPQLNGSQNELFGKLNSVEAEISEISKILPDSTQMLNESFTKETLQRQISSSAYNVVHLATHGQFRYNAEDTFILVAAGSENASDKTSDKNSTRPEFIQADKITLNDFQTIFSQSTEPIQLLVFSACETGIGDNRAILGLAGISVRSGARSALATLWGVDDLSSVIFMQKFYTYLKDTSLSKAQAMQKAQIDLLREPEIYRPSHWAPYVLIGDWR